MALSLFQKTVRLSFFSTVSYGVIFSILSFGRYHLMHLIRRQVHTGWCGELWLGMCILHSGNLRQGPGIPAMDQELDLERGMLGLFLGGKQPFDHSKADHHCIFQ